MFVKYRFACICDYACFQRVFGGIKSIRVEKNEGDGGTGGFNATNHLPLTSPVILWKSGSVLF